MSKSQTKKLEDLLLDYKPHRTDEIMRVVYGGDHLGVARIGARINDLKKKGYNIPTATRDKFKNTLYWYQIIKEPNQEPVQMELFKKSNLLNF